MISCVRRFYLGVPLNRSAFSCAVFGVSEVNYKVCLSGSVFSSVRINTLNSLI